VLHFRDSFFEILHFRYFEERSKTAKSAVELIGELVEKYGQGGVCFNASDNFTFGYDNSFLVVDNEEAWSVETCNHVWVAKQIKEGYYSMSNVYSIEDDYNLQSNNLEKFAKENNFWDGKDKLNFAQAFQGKSPCTDARLKGGRKLLENLTKNGNFSVFDMISILRDEESGICAYDKTRGVRTTSSQVSILTTNKNSSINACHFITGTPNPKQSLFKPIIFSKNVTLGPLTVSTPEEIIAQRTHPLYATHQKVNWEKFDRKHFDNIEHEGIMKIVSKLKSTDDKDIDNLDTLFHDAASTEIELLRGHSSS
ncbi:unnamed protein product, partial [Adineta steineri]